MFFHNKDRKTKPDEYKLTHSTCYIIIGISGRKRLEQNYLSIYLPKITQMTSNPATALHKMNT